MYKTLAFPEDTNAVYIHFHSHPTLKVCHSALFFQKSIHSAFRRLAGSLRDLVGEARNNRLSPGTYDRRVLALPVPPPRFASGLYNSTYKAQSAASL